MIPRSFDYLRPTSLDEAISALTEYDDEAKILAGGHSLLPVMKLRLADPAVLVDLCGVPGLSGVRLEGDKIVVGAMTTHYTLTTDPLVREHCRILAEVTAQVGDRQVRYRGTLGGALAHSDAAGDQPALALALDAELVAQGPDGRRVIPAAQFFLGFFENSLEPDEVLVEIRLPKLDDSWSFNYQKFNRVEQGWAIVGSCALLRRDATGVTDARVGLTNMGTGPLRAAGTEKALIGAPATAESFAAAAARAADGTNPPGDPHAQPDYRRHLAEVLTRRALENAVAAPGH
jgi:carbon-monoxide dehydrogenase medium subunit